MNRLSIAGIAALIVAGFLGNTSLFTVEQTEKVLVVQFGRSSRIPSCSTTGC
jgi:regulator of protease activity HflC (stomatin/prohibitin superfamily)